MWVLRSKCTWVEGGVRDICMLWVQARKVCRNQWRAFWLGRIRIFEYSTTNLLSFLKYSKIWPNIRPNIRIRQIRIVAPGARIFVLPFTGRNIIDLAKRYAAALWPSISCLDMLHIHALVQVVSLAIICTCHFQALIISRRTYHTEFWPLSGCEVGYPGRHDWLSSLILVLGHCARAAHSKVGFNCREAQLLTFPAWQLLSLARAVDNCHCTSRWLVSYCHSRFSRLRSLNGKSNWVSVLLLN